MLCTSHIDNELFHVIYKSDIDSVDNLTSKSSEYLAYISLNSSDLRKYMLMEEKDEVFLLMPVRLNDSDLP